MKIVIRIILTVLVWLLLLTTTLAEGQTFTQAIMYLGGFWVIIILWGALLFSNTVQAKARIVSIGIIFAHLILSAVLVVNLSAEYKKQKEFNKRVTIELNLIDKENHITND